eukprot:TRINITY_DN2305_c0_g1_i2.p1 TRINITY_DN2305_c0_g1~~TRINITY_DN2305_c0_g1_i2.p1  ORF type:complete len:502 (+),score=118.42 TRINITY_DN2305_c0_g1_i2:155-1660(+)
MLPEWFNKVSLAFVLFTQLVGPFLLVAPFVAVRRVGVLLQVVSMIGIQLTGNYNWFNLHALLLVLPSWAADSKEDAVQDLPDSLLQRVVAGFVGVVLAAAYMWEVSEDAALGLTLAVIAVAPGLGEAQQRLQVALALPVMGALFLAMFSSYDVASLQVTAFPVNNMTPAAIKWLLGAILPTVFRYLTAVVVVSGMLQLLDCIRSRGSEVVRALRVPTNIMLLAVVLLLLPCTLEPLKEIHSSVPKQLKFGGSSATVTEFGLRNVAQQLRTAHAVSGYGLFRTMTGVGKKGDVAVPVLVLEYTTSKHPKEWQEVQFRYAPGKTSVGPQWVAPHQPRLDWRLWFAALGSLRSDPWVMHLATKILRNSTAALNLVGLQLPPKQKPRHVRGVLYHYNYTRNLSDPEWWSRRRVKEWLPPVSLQSNEVRNFMDHFGWTMSPKERTPAVRSDWAKATSGLIRETRNLMQEIRQDGLAVQFIGMILAAVFMPKITHLILFAREPQGTQ